MSHRPTIALASASPRRRELLEGTGLRVLLVAGECDEERHTGETVRDYVRRLAADKLQAGRAAHPDVDPELPWLAADTVVWFPSTDAGAANDEAIGKPVDRDEARTFVRAITSGRPHAVTTGWALAVAGRSEPELHEETTRVYMRSLSEAEIESYLDTAHWQDKAGAYAIQAEAASWVTRVEGSYTNIVGLPLAQVLGRLLELTPTRGPR